MGLSRTFSRVRLFARVIGQSLIALKAYALRSAFVVAATALGIASLTIIIAAVDGAQKKAVEITEMFGPDAAFVLGGDIFSRAVGQRVLTLSYDDARAIRDQLPGAYLVVPMRAKQNVKVRLSERNFDLDTLVGSSANYAEAWNWPLAEGRDISAADEESAARVALLGETPRRELFGDAQAIGQVIFIQNIPFEVVGLLSYRGAQTGGGSDIDNRIIVPISTLTQRFNMDRKYFRALRVKFRNPELMRVHTANLRSFLRHLHGLGPTEPDDFTILTADEVLKFLSVIQGGLVVFLGVTASVAIIVGGFVLANLFYLSVSERTREIGLRKAFGARASAILVQILAEAVILTIIGAMLGLVLGLSVGQLLARLGLLEITFSWKIFTIALAASIAIGLIFGLRPARRAASMDPIEALRS